MPRTDPTWIWTALQRLPERRDDILGVANGAIGDRLEADGSPHAFPMDVRHQGLPLDLDAPLDVPGASGDVVVLVHGLMATDRFWSLSGDPSFGERLRDDVGATPVAVRYNTGRHISTNGQELARLLARLVARWPVPVTRLSIVAHSMGGLVTRSACHYGAGSAWLPLLSQVFLLGVPQRGAPLEQLAHVAAFTLAVIPNPWTWGISWIMRQRSDGIRDLRHGYVIDEEWTERSKDGLSLGKRYAAAIPEHVAHYVIAGALTADPDHPLTRVLGDAVVPPRSARDEGWFGEGLPPTAARVFPGLSHGALASHDDVYAQILAWWAR